MLILWFNFIPCYLLEVSHRVMIGYSLRYSKVIEYPTKDSPLQSRESIPMDPCQDHYSEISGHSGNAMKSVLRCIYDE